MKAGIRPAVAQALDELRATADALLDLDTGDRGDGAADMAELLFPLLSRTREELGDPAVKAEWAERLAGFYAGAKDSSDEYRAGALGVAGAFVALCRAIRGAQTTPA